MPNKNDSNIVKYNDFNHQADTAKKRTQDFRTVGKKTWIKRKRDNLRLNDLSLGQKWVRNINTVFISLIL